MLPRCGSTQLRTCVALPPCLVQTSAAGCLKKVSLSWQVFSPPSGSHCAKMSAGVTVQRGKVCASELCQSRLHRWLSHESNTEASTVSCGGAAIHELNGFLHEGHAPRQSFLVAPSLAVLLTGQGCIHTQESRWHMWFSHTSWLPRARGRYPKHLLAA